MKGMGIFLILFSGFLCSYNIKKNYKKRIEVIEEFIKNLEIMSTQISFYKMNVYDILIYLYSSSGNPLKKFYEEIVGSIEKDGVENSFKKSLYSADAGFNNKDKKLISEFAHTLGNTDYNTQLNSIEATKELFKYELYEAKNNRDRNEKAKCTLVMSSFIVLALILI